ncbi:sulfatase [Bacteroides sp. 519]|uniref:sulfatase family protein n=1 Tax=Bacteroides sp. 519 TaxID=2302937 RepID=UPI0013D88E67|nr:sulfatase [Bacteroides sp. 519]NDV59693.1 sulfatase [Bacteroides sp. 519]
MLKLPTTLTLSMSTGLLLLGCQKQPTVVKQPNILFVINDDQSFVHTSFAGSKFVNTPGFDYIAKNGIYFNNCYAGSPGSAPSRSTLVTGRYHWQNEQSGQHGSSWMKKHVPFVDVLAANGYHTGFTGKGVGPFQYARNENDSLWRKQNAAGQPYNKHRYKKGDPSDVRTAGGIESINYYENFRDFLEHRNQNQSFYFWYGSTEPHRAYEKDSWKRNGKNLADVDVPAFMPNSDVIRGDMLDYAVEIEWADMHLTKMLHHLDSIGELDNTIVIVTADNGMAFPRAKANCFEYGVHVPFAISYPNGFPGKRQVNDPISFADIAPTLLEMAGVKPDGMLPISGRSMVNILKSTKEGIVDETKKYVLAGRERHSSSRWNNLGYPQRAIRSTEYLYIWNMKPERYPAGAPDVYADVDDSPSKFFLQEEESNPEIAPYYELTFGHRPEIEFYNIKDDPYCLNNLAGNTVYATIETEMRTALMKELEKSEDPRIVGPDKDVFENYIRYLNMREFPKPDWAK